MDGVVVNVLGNEAAGRLERHGWKLKGGMQTDENGRFTGNFFITFVKELFSGKQFSACAVGNSRMEIAASLKNLHEGYDAKKYAEVCIEGREAVSMATVKEMVEEGEEMEREFRYLCYVVGGYRQMAVAV